MIQVLDLHELKMLLMMFGWKKVQNCWKTIRLLCLSSVEIQSIRSLTLQLSHYGDAFSMNAKHNCEFGMTQFRSLNNSDNDNHQILLQVIAFEHSMIPGFIF